MCLLFVGICEKVGIPVWLAWELIEKTLSIGRMSAKADPNEYIRKTEDHKIRKPPRTEIHVWLVIFVLTNRWELPVPLVSPSVLSKRTGFVLSVEIAITQRETSATTAVSESRLVEAV